MPQANSSPMGPSSIAWILPLCEDLPISLRKGTNSFRNPHPIYNFPIYHRLFAFYFTFFCTISFIPLPKRVHEALFHQDKNKQWLKKGFLYILLEREIWSLYLMTSLL